MTTLLRRWSWRTQGALHQVLHRARHGENATAAAKRERRRRDEGRSDLLFLRNCALGRRRVRGESRRRAARSNCANPSERSHPDAPPPRPGSCGSPPALLPSRGFAPTDCDSECMKEVWSGSSGARMLEEEKNENAFGWRWVEREEGVDRLGRTCCSRMSHQNLQHE